MTRTLLTVLLISLFGSLVASCDKIDTPSEEVIKAKIVGKWKTESRDGVETPTNKKIVTTMTADGAMYSTVLLNSKWHLSKEAVYTITGNKFASSSTRTQSEGIITAIDDNVLEFSDYTSSTPKGTHHYDKYVNARVTNDFSESIIGMWEGVELTGEVTFGAENHRWEFKNNGTYAYYTKNSSTGNWSPDPSNSGNVYYVDGDFLSFRWIRENVEYQEWWDIKYCNSNEMLWYALRLNEDKSSFETTLKMKRVN